jgi:hypothetical protein
MKSGIVGHLNNKIPFEFFFSQIAVAVNTFYLDPCIYVKEKWQLVTLLDKSIEM